MHDVFISYSRKDTELAENLLSRLEESNIKCWVAFRDIQIGANWAEEIVDAIENAKVMILLVSSRFNESRQTRKEIILGIEEGLLVAPIIVEQFKPSAHLRYFLADCHWIEAYNNAFQDKLNIIVGTISHYIDHGSLMKGTWDDRKRKTKVENVTVEGTKLCFERLNDKIKLTVDKPITDPNKQPSNYLRPCNAFIPLIGRDEEIANLNEFLDDKSVFRWQVICGEGGMGKTRLANEFARIASRKGWYSGFLKSPVLSALQGWEEFSYWTPVAPTLIIIDYAASQFNNLKILLSRCAELAIQEFNDDSLKVRIILLERHANKEDGWLSDFLQSCQGADNELLNRCFQGITVLEPPGFHDRSDNSVNRFIRDIISATFISWSQSEQEEAPELPDFTDQDYLDIKTATGNKPLYVQMAAIHACETGSATGLPHWRKGQLIKAAVDREIRYISARCDDANLTKLLQHLAAILCLGGVASSKTTAWHNYVGNYIQRYYQNYMFDFVEQTRRSIFLEPPQSTEGKDVGLLQPDIVSEGFALHVLISGCISRGNAIPPVDLLLKILELSKGLAWANFIRMVQDLHGWEYDYQGETPSIIVEAKKLNEWLYPLIEHRSLDEIMQVSKSIPEYTTSLHEFGVHVNRHIANNIPSADKPKKAFHLMKLGIHQHRESDREYPQVSQAAASIHQAIELLESMYNDLETEQLLHLAVSYRHYCDMLNELNKNDLSFEYCNKSIRLLENLLLNNANGTVSEIKRYLAHSLNSLSIVYRSFLKAQEAYDSSYRAVEISREFMNLDNDCKAEYARYENNLGQVILFAVVNKLPIKIATSHTSLLEQALEHCVISSINREELMHVKPDEYADLLTKSLTTVLEIQYRLERFDDARKTAEKLFKVYEDLAARNPSKYAEDQARTLQNAGVLALQSKQKKGGVYATLESLKIRERLAENKMDEYGEQLATGYFEVGTAFKDSNDIENARLYFTKSLDLGRKLIRSRMANRREGKKHIKKVILPALPYCVLGLMELASTSEERLTLLDSITTEDIETNIVENDKRGNFYNDVALAFFFNKEKENAIKYMNLSVQCYSSSIQETSKADDPYNWAVKACNLSSVLCFYGDWSEQVELLDQAIEYARGALVIITPRIDRFTWGATLDNLGHSLARKGQLENNPELVKQGIAELKKALDNFIEMERPKAIENVQGDLNRFTEILQGMMN